MNTTRNNKRGAKRLLSKYVNIDIVNNILHSFPLCCSRILGGERNFMSTSHVASSTIPMTSSVWTLKSWAVKTTAARVSVRYLDIHH